MILLDYTKTRESQSALARRIGVPTVCVNQWAHGTRQVPAERCIDIERATGGVVTCEELRPDMADRWGYLRGTYKPEGAAPSSICSEPSGSPIADHPGIDDDWGSGDPRHGESRRPEQRSGKERRDDGGVDR